MRNRFVFIIMLVSVLFFIVGCTTEKEQEEKRVNPSSLPEFQFKKGEFPPTLEAFVKLEDTRYDMTQGGFEWRNGAQATTTDALSPPQIAENFAAIDVVENSVAYIEIEQTPNLQLFLWADEENHSSIQLNGNQFTIPTTKGRYIYEVRAKWENGEVSYTFVVEVK